MYELFYVSQVFDAQKHFRCLDVGRCTTLVQTEISLQLFDYHDILYKYLCPPLRLVQMLACIQIKVPPLVIVCLMFCLVFILWS